MVARIHPLLTLILLLGISSCVGFQSYQGNIPNGANVMRGTVAWPGVGHDRSSGGGPLNVFGTAFKAAGNSWTQSLCEADSDGDGFSNGVELGDPDCQWTSGGSPPSRTSDISHPGFSDSFPASLTLPPPPATTSIPTTGTPTEAPPIATPQPASTTTEPTTLEPTSAAPATTPGPTEGMTPLPAPPPTVPMTTTRTIAVVATTTSAPPTAVGSESPTTVAASTSESPLTPEPSTAAVTTTSAPPTTHAPTTIIPSTTDVPPTTSTPEAVETPRPSFNVNTTFTIFLSGAFDRTSFTNGIAGLVAAIPSTVWVEQIGDREVRVSFVSQAQASALLAANPLQLQALQISAVSLSTTAPPPPPDETAVEAWVVILIVLLVVGIIVAVAVVLFIKKPWKPKGAPAGRRRPVSSYAAQHEEPMLAPPAAHRHQQPLDQAYAGGNGYQQQQIHAQPQHNRSELLKFNHDL